MGPSEPHREDELPGIDWATAEIDDGDLTVELTGKTPKGWAKRFEAVLALLGRTSAGWGEIAVRKQRIKVKGVLAGSEGDLRHLIESALQQVNSDFAPDHDEGADEDARDEGHPDEGDRDDAEREMAETFRGFAKEQG
jgi:hypothetical protein